MGIIDIVRVGVLPIKTTNMSGGIPTQCSLTGGVLRDGVKSSMIRKRGASTPTINTTTAAL